jgi:hypothetical protein
MPTPPNKNREAQVEATPEPQKKKQPLSRNGLIAEEFEMDCWEPSLRDRLHKASGQKKA